jgi:hypothetical protein
MGLGSNQKRPQAPCSSPAAKAPRNALATSAARQKQKIKARLRLLTLLLQTIDGQAAHFATLRRDILSSRRKLDGEANQPARRKSRTSK